MNLPTANTLLSRSQRTDHRACHGDLCSSWRSRRSQFILSLASVMTLSLGLSVRPAQAQGTVPPPAPPNYASYTLALGQQYLVYVNGNSPLLLDQVRLVEPESFVTTLEGRSVIQAGRFNDWNNAQSLVNDLSGLGIGAQIQTTAAVSNPGPPVYPTAAVPSPVVTTATTDLPPLPVTAAPPVVDFGQAPSATPPGTAYPSAALPAAPATNAGNSRGYYVVVPGAQRDLPSLAQQIVSSGAPGHLVQMRQAPRGPHVAVGPFNDRGVAEDWSRYLTDTGLGTRVHYE